MELLNKYFVEICLKKYATFQGRASRKEFWMFVLCAFVLLFGLSVLGAVLHAISSTLGTVFFSLVGLCALIIFLPGLALSVRRVQDVGKPWWTVFIPFYNLYLYFQEGKE